MALPMLLLGWMRLKQTPCDIHRDRHHHHHHHHHASTISKLIVVLLPMYLWFGIVFSRPHKEERFLFPIYPLLAIGSAVFLDQLMDVTVMIQKSIGNVIGRDVCTVRTILSALVLIPCMMVSISRSMSLADGYAAPLKLYTHLYGSMMNDAAFKTAGESQHHQHQQQQQQQSQSEIKLVCTGGEWYRFPSSYYLPDNARLAFLKSSFDGQLPQLFTEFGSKEQSSSVQGRFNDWNEEEMDRYVDIQDCSYVIELLKEDDNNDVTAECVSYMQRDDHDWELIGEIDFLDADKTKLLHRVLYLPFLRGRRRYQRYALFARQS
eukprot:CAMPEP_0197238608 /NCGR_PEP_ID=MMETSP1429-20130617/5109_1 /TAXON_ID=49237 /ORGANISM="Chaetoceros  sp., Strain UNC1202" /LENGTH=319 /DNA_ID=CAMNT_0042697813 /DNA_START=16 /DNA_END=975 /DNA_ORIENTATION=+